MSIPLLPRILIVDDNAANRKSLRTVLRDINAELVEADNGFDALSLCLDQEFALVLLDVQMPEMDGYEVCAALRENPATEQTPVIFLTAAFKEDSHRIQGYDSGATDYLAKPIVGPLLQCKVKVFLRLYQQQQELQRVNRELERLASTDALTGANNRRAFMEHGAAELARSKRHGTPLAMALIDIDHFKQVNDEHGHNGGDEVLKDLVAHFRGLLRAEDLFARIGGEEFAVLFVESGLDAARAKIESILEQQRQHHLDLPSGRVAVSFSAGMGELRDSDRTLSDLMARVDKLLYQAKNTGRNRVCSD